MESRLIHFVEELNRVASILNNPSKHTNNVLSQMKVKKNQLIAKVDSLPRVEGLTQVTYIDTNGKVLATTLIKADSIYEKEFFARSIAKEGNLEYHKAIFAGVMTGKISRTK